MEENKTVDYYLKTAWQSIVNKYNQIAVQYGLTQASGYVLINIHREGTPVSQIANLLGVKTTSLSRMLNNLEESGFIYRKVNAQDKRSTKVYLTPLGVQKRKIAKQVVRDFNQYLGADLHPEEIRITVEALVKLTEKAKAYTPLETIQDYKPVLNHIENE